MEIHPRITVLKPPLTRPNPATRAPPDSLKQRAHAELKLLT